MIKVKKLTTENAEDFFRFFETDAHGDNPNEERCYCINWVSADHSDKPNFSNPDTRKEYAKQYIKEGRLQGYLAYDQERVVGWCNSNTKADCVKAMGWQYYMKEIPLDVEMDKRTKSIYCFAIAPDMKRKGIASRLLEAICLDAKADGFQYVEVFPIKEAKNNFMAFMGPVDLYRKHGFEIVDETERDYIMRKEL